MKTSLLQTTISNLEAGETNARIDTLLDVMTSLGLEIVIRLRTKSSAQDI